jgi:hypothetical protein
MQFCSLVKHIDWIQKYKFIMLTHISTCAPRIVVVFKIQNILAKKN